MNLSILILLWFVAVLIALGVWRWAVKRVLSMNKALLTSIDEILFAIDKLVMENFESFVDPQKTLAVLEQERQILREKPYNLKGLENRYKTLINQYEFVKNLLEAQEVDLISHKFLEEMEKIWKMTKFFCQVKKLAEAMLVILTLGLFVLVKRRMLGSVYIYC